MRVLSCIAFFLLALQVAATDAEKFQVSGYGIINYAKFDWEVDPGRRAHIDVERFVVAPKYRMSDNIRLEAELRVRARRHRNHDGVRQA